MDIVATRRACERERETHTHIQTHTLALDKLNMLTRHYSRKHCYVSRGTKRYKRLASASMSQRCDQTSDDAFSAPRGASLPRAVCQDNLNPATLPVQVRAVCVCVCVCVCVSVCLSFTASKAISSSYSNMQHLR